MIRGGSGQPSTGNVDPLTGQTTADTGGDGNAGSPAVSTSLAGYRSSSLSVMFAVITGCVLLLALVAPPLVAHQLSRRRAALGDRGPGQ